MLEIGSKTLTVEGITIFADHADPNQFWYLPGPVQLARRREDNRAAFTLIKYGGVQEKNIVGGGFLMFEVNLGLNANVERRILTRLSTLAPDRPKLAAVPFDEGTVEVIALNLQGPGGTTATLNAAGAFQAVEKILGATVPSLHGDNRAAFSLSLSKEGATLLDQVFTEQGTPVGVVYALKYTGLRPALEVEITANLKLIYDHFSANLAGQIYFVRAGIDVGFEKLVQAGVIQIKVINYSTAADRQEKENWALEFFKEKLLNEWFRPTLTPGKLAGGLAQAEDLDVVRRRAAQMRPPRPPAPPPPDSEGKSTDEPPAQPPSATQTRADQNTGAPEVSGVILNPPTEPGTNVPTMPPASSQPAPRSAAGLQVPARNTPNAANQPVDSAVISFQLKFIHQEELKTITLRYTRAEAVQRTYAPQGFFGLLAQDLAHDGHLLEVDLDDPFFREFTVSVEAPFDLQRIGLASAHVQLDYGSNGHDAAAKHKDLIIDVTSPVKQAWMVKSIPGLTAYMHQVQYHFDPDTDWQGEQYSYQLPALTTEDRTLLIHPFAGLGFLEIEISANNIDWSIVSDLDAQLRYQAPNGWQREQHFFFTESDHTRKTWRLRLSQPEARTYTYQCIYRLKDGAQRTSELIITQATKIDLPNPFYAIDLEFIPLFEVDKVRLVFIDVEYDDVAASFTQRERLRLDGSSLNSARLRLHVVDPTKRTYRYRFTAIGHNGSLVRGQFIETSETLIGVAV